MKYNDNSVAPIIAWDFDGTICIDGYPDPYKGKLRQYVREVMMFLDMCGMKSVIWTSRDVAINQDKFQVYDDLTSVVNYLRDNNIPYASINKSVQFAPFKYNGRKIYAHKYVDDRAYGWIEAEDVMLDVLVDILHTVLEFGPSMSSKIGYGIINCNEEDMTTYVRQVKQRIKKLWNRTADIH